jgi:hypothetical protein
VASICIACFNIKRTLYFAHRMYFCVLHDSKNEQWLFPYTALTCWAFTFFMRFHPAILYNGDATCFLWSRNQIFKWYLEEYVLQRVNIYNLSRIYSISMKVISYTVSVNSYLCMTIIFKYVQQYCFKQIFSVYTKWWTRGKLV